MENTVNTIMLVEDVVNQRLIDAADPDLSFEERSKALREAKEAQHFLDHLNDKQTNEKQKNKLDVNQIIKIVEIGVPVVLFIGDCLFKNYFMKSVCNFEKDYTFTTTPGRSVSGLFKFK